MQFKSLIIASLASFALAQTATTSAPHATTSSTCAAQNILDACKATIQGQINSCATTDYSCLCSAYTNMLTCYNNCPNDVTVGTVQQQRTLYCNDASVYGSSTSTHAVAASTASSAASMNTASTTSAQSGSTSSTRSTASSTATSSTNGATCVNTRNGLLLAAVGIAAML